MGMLNKLKMAMWSHRSSRLLRPYFDGVDYHRNNRKRRVFSFSHSEYLRIGGGVQNVIGDEAAAFNSLGWDYFHFSPKLQLATLSSNCDAKSFFMDFSYNGDFIGTITFNSLLKLSIENRDFTHLVVFHQLLGHSPSLLAELVKRLSWPQCVYWVHDYFGLCTNYNLLKNGISFCGAPEPDSATCQSCRDGIGRPNRTKLIKSFLVATKAEIVAPSEPAAEIFKRSLNTPNLSIKVVPLARLEKVNHARMLYPKVASPKRAIRVGYIGAKAYHKGWNLFASLVQRFGGDARYEFIYLGSNLNSHQRIINLIQHETIVTAKKRMAMTQAVADQKIDVVVIWPEWPETFSFVTFEALAAGAFIVTNSKSGNVCSVLKRFAKPHGISLESIEQIFDLFENEKLYELVFSESRPKYELKILPGTASFIR